MRRDIPHDLELVAVVFALKFWGHYLYEENTQIYTDHESLKCFFTLKEQNMRKQRWLEFVKDYDIDIHYHPKKASMVTSAFSRNTAHSSVLIARDARVQKDFE